MKDLQRRLVVLVSGLLLLAAVFVSYRAGERFESSLAQQRLGVALEIGRSVAVVVERALAFGVPFDQLVDTERFLEAVKLDNPGVDYIIITTLDGQLRYSTDLSRVGNAAGLRGSVAVWNGRERTARIGRYFNTAIAINGKGGQLGWLHLGERANIIEQLLRDIVFDILTVLVVAMLGAFELMRVLLAASFATPLRTINEFFTRIASGDFRRTLARDFFGGIGRLNGRINAIVSELNARARRRQAAGATMPPGLSFDLSGERSSVRASAIENIRWSFFLLIFAESLSLSFFPIFVAQFYDPAFGLPLHVVIGIPITVFMLVWAITMPFAGTWCDRIGYRLAFSVGAAMTTIGLFLTAYSTSLADLLLWRSITAVGYGIVYVTTQAYITVFVPTKEGTQGQAMFLASFFTGSLSGAAIGGILVDRLGFAMTFLLSAGLSAIAALYVLRSLGDETGRTVAKKALTLADFKLLVRHKHFAIVTFLSAVPAKVALAGFLYYSVPLYLKGLGYNQSITGRVMMAYGLAIILIGPMVARLADQAQTRRRRFVMLGGYAAALAMAVPLLVEDMKGAVIAVIGLGVAHAVGVSPQMTLINDRCGETVREVGQATAVGIFRLVERIGTITGPILLGAMIALSGFMGAFVVLALFTFATTTLFTLLLWWSDRDAAPVKIA
jgi:predicted MFS family arabinose efflux permease/HAMP domain-containing protein